MRMLSRRDLLPLGPLVVRAFLLYVGLKLVLIVVGLIVGGSGGEGFDNPVGIIIFGATLGTVDLHRRHETTLWANLGYPPTVMAALVGLMAVAGEIVWALL